MINSFCRIAETWIGCTYLLQGLNCFEPNAQALGGGSSSYTAMLEQLGHTGTDWPEDNLNVMAKIYKSQCDSARFAAQSMQSYGGMGMGDYYGGGYDYDGTDGVDEPQETNKDLWVECITLGNMHDTRGPVYYKHKNSFDTDTPRIADTCHKSGKTIYFNETINHVWRQRTPRKKLNFFPTL